VTYPLPDTTTTAPSTSARYCAAYNQLTSVDNIHMDALDCLNTAGNTASTTKFRYICEVSDECTAIFFSRLHKILHTHTNGNVPHTHIAGANILGGGVLGVGK
jgi:hypothetical protein